MAEDMDAEVAHVAILLASMSRGQRRVLLNSLRRRVKLTSEEFAETWQLVPR